MAFIQSIFDVGSKIFGSNIWKKFWHLGVSLMIILILFFGGIIESFKEKSPEPFVNDVLLPLAMIDHSTYVKFKTINEEGGLLMPEEYQGKFWRTFFNRALTLIKLLGYLWVLGYVWFIFFYIFHRTNTSANIQSASLGTLCFFTFLLLTNTMFMGVSGELAGVCENSKYTICGKMFTEVIPFKWTIEMAKAIPKITTPVYNVSKKVKPLPTPEEEIPEQDYDAYV